jgi:hypothetical protein
MSYSRTFQAVGWRHCLPGGNNQPAAPLRRRPSEVATKAWSIRLIIPGAEGLAANLLARSMDRSLLHPHAHWQHIDAIK